MYDRLVWRLGRLVDVRQAIREMDVSADFHGDDLGIVKSQIYLMGGVRYDD